MSKLERLKKTKSLSDLAKLLGFTPKGLSYVVHQIPDAKKYRVFDIPKKTGGTRTIKAPVEQLSLLQSRLAELLTECVEELIKDNPRYWAASHGFRKSRTIVSNASAHRKRRYVFNVDLADFFGTINFGRVRGYFIKDNSFGLDPAVATVIAQIACHENALPQGSPCSPVISNLVANILDARLLRLAKSSGCTFTRYADDLTFSTNKTIFPHEIAKELAGADWEVGKQLQELIERSGYTLNIAKTRMSLRQSRQTVTGLVVNEKPNISQDYYRCVRAMCHSVFTTGSWYRPVQAAGAVPVPTASLRPVEGMLSHIYFVKARRDRSHKMNKDAGFISPKTPTRLYKEFLFYKHFVASPSPMIVTEGISDITYIKCAIRSLAAKFPLLASVKGSNVTPEVAFLNPTGTSRSVLNLGHGASGQGNLVDQYASSLKCYRHLPLTSPVIILCDNDDGPKEVFSKAQKKSGVPISLTTTNPFYHLGQNLYLVKVPEGVPPGKRDIEDLFPAAWLGQLVDGKPFDKKKAHGDHTAYGKVIFAEKVVRPNAAKIDFTAFEELLERIEGCIKHYAATVAAKVPAATASAPAAKKSAAGP